MATQEHARTALVIGGGIAGPAAAMALHRAGIRSTVYEAYEKAAHGIGGILGLAPNGLAALELVGAAGAVRAVAQPTPRSVAMGADGTVFGEFGAASGAEGNQVVWRQDLFRVLHDTAAAQGIRTEYGKRLIGIDEGPDGVTARFADGSSATADVLVGADGIRSAVRPLIDPDAPDAEHVPLLGLGGSAAYEVPGAAPDTMYFVFGSAFVGHWADGPGRTAWFTNLPHEARLTADEARRTPMAEWLERAAAVMGGQSPGRELVAHTRPETMQTFGTLEILPSVPRWWRGRTVLVGDSAHAPSPSSGQGASLAAESAVELARCLRDLPIAEAFAAYEGLRRPRVERIAARAAQTNRAKAAGQADAGGEDGSGDGMAEQAAAEQGFTIDWDAPVRG